MPIEHRDFIKRENVTCIGHLVEIGLVAIVTVPASVLYTFPLLVLQRTIDDLKCSGQSLAGVASRWEDLCASFEERRVKAKEMRGKVDPSAEVDEPPEPFTQMPILPTLEELYKKSSQVYLRSNIVAGGYKSWDHYFDIQFRLLREDFVRPLREGIERYCVTGSSRGISDIRVYENARILNPVCLYTGMGFQFRFDVTKLQNVKWEHSRRLIFGSLLCLSDDEFREHVIFATVVKRDPKHLNEGLLTIKFEDGTNGFAINPIARFKMVESTAYFETYRYVLEALQNLSRNPDLMPMKGYIVDCVNYKDILRVPGFLNLPSSPAVFDMKDILNTTKQFNVTDLTKWPIASQTGLDDSQLEALKTALTQELAVIQGPPGTGKTFIGIKIAETYLKNRHVWDPQRASPIFVVCYTNHALDQFLEGIQHIKGFETTPNIIRIGGRCKSEPLSRCLLREKVQNCRANKSVPSGLFRRYQEARSEMFDCQKYINLQIGNCDAESCNKIVELSTLGNCINEYHVNQLEFGQVTEKGKEIEVWLGLWYPDGHDNGQQASAIQQEGHEIDIGLHNDMELSVEELIEVDNEARVLQDDRMIEGEDIELIGAANHSQRMSNKTKTASKPKMSPNDWSIVQLSVINRKKLISKGYTCNPMSKQEADQVDKIWSLPDKQRWMLYLYWVNSYMMQCKNQIDRHALRYNQACENYSECQKEIDCYVAQDSDVIGMTTTGAVKYHHLLKSLRPKIVIFEEAAEVLEAHLVTSIASSVQQVILIGDHKQLRPKPTCYKLEKDYNLGVSLFERLVDPKVCAASSSSSDGFPFVTLEVQHRMRPEISKLIHPSIYKKIVDAPNVMEYGHVKGVSKDLYFISHASHEEHNTQNDLKSHINKFEADYIVQLCHYLLKQGYSPSDVTILSMYRGQLLELKRRMKRQDFEGVRVAAVDDFQGEENTIIILSLVRSNPESKIGFLKIENRVCVSLSRAKEGLYIIGNGSMLKDKDCTKWPEILAYLERENCIGNGLPLYCQNHPSDRDIMFKPDDFKKRPEGGCQKICGARLSCGHACPRVCHIRDPDHKMTRCTKTCNKQFSCGHFCQRKCFECKKNMRCMPCSVYVEIQLPLCHHKIKAACSVRADQISCPIACSEILDCGHQCQKTCSAPCTTSCKELVIKQLPCDHVEEVACFKDPESVLCSAKCDVILKCGDPCQGTCGKCMQGRLHVKCEKKCSRSLMCGHAWDFPCASICPPCNKPCNNRCIHSECPKKCYEPCSPCMEQCEWKCAHLECSKPCGQFCDRPPCNKPCPKLLPCNHQCIGLCGEKCPKKCRICHSDEVCEIFLGNEDELDALFIELQDCGHIFEVGNLDTWMDTDTSKSNEVMFKTCPRCKTSIRRSVRYGNHIKQVLRDVDIIKLKQMEDPTTISTCLQTARKEIRDLRKSYFIDDDIAHISQETASAPPNCFHAAVIKFQLSLLPNILQLKNLIDDLDHQVDISGFTPLLSEKLLVKLKEFVMQEFLSAQQCSDIIFEMRRLSCLIKLLDLLCKIRIKSPSIHLDADFKAMSNQIKALHRAVNQKMSEEKEKEVVEFIKKLSLKYHVNGLSNEEKLKIVDAIGLPKGHWFKCQNGHLYCIGECGGAMEVSKCPECKVSIGGTQHTLVYGNVHAGEMDGSRHPVWSEAANMANFDPADFDHHRL